MATKLSLPSDVPVLSVWIEHPDLDDDSALSSLMAFMVHLDTLRKCCPVELEIRYTLSQNGKAVPQDLLRLLYEDGLSPMEIIPCTTPAIPVTIPK